MIDCAKEPEAIYRAELQKKRLRLKNLIENNGFKESDELCDDIYLCFLTDAADLEMALLVENWENADEIADTLLDHPKYKGKKRYAIIVYKILESSSIGM